MMKLAVFVVMCNMRHFAICHLVHRTSNLSSGVEKFDSVERRTLMHLEFS